MLWDVVATGLIRERSMVSHRLATGVRKVGGGDIDSRNCARKALCYTVRARTPLPEEFVMTVMCS